MNNEYVGLCLAFKGRNYGMLLQAYATQTIIENLGYKTEIIDYERTNNKHIRFTPYLAVFLGKQLQNKVKRKFNKGEIMDDEHKKNMNLRTIAADKFRDERLHNIVKYKGIENLEKGSKKFSTVLVGSDQQWLPDVAFSNYRTLRFVPENINKISYATSLGVSEYPFYCKSSARQFLNRMNHISVREEEGKNIISKLCDTSIEVVLDPTYLLTEEQWKDLIVPDRIEKEEYVLCYFLGNNSKAKQKAREYADKYHLKLVTIMSDESDSDDIFADKIISGASPEEFVNLIRYASQVFTDSFHGIAFSIINRKQFYTFYRVREGEKSRNSRIDNILRQWKLERRLIKDEALECDLIENINYEEVNQILNKRREESLKFLMDSLKDGKHGNA